MLELWAVDLPELHHLNDVIVFSTQGERPDFNKIAGSDLDGDGYFVC
jgi:RNA-dependent RNA polymerase